MTSKDNLQPLRDLADQWLRDLPHMDTGAANATQACLDELTAALANLSQDACDCTAGVEHVHVTGNAFRQRLIDTGSGYGED